MIDGGQSQRWLEDEVPSKKPRVRELRIKKKRLVSTKLKDGSRLNYIGQGMCGGKVFGCCECSVKFCYFFIDRRQALAAHCYGRRC